MRTVLLLIVLVVLWPLPPGFVSATSGTAVDSIHTIDAKTRAGVKTNVVLINPKYERENLGRTQDNGVLPLSPPRTCTSGMTLEVVSGSAWYPNTTKAMECSPQEFVHLQRVEFSSYRLLKGQRLLVPRLANNITAALNANDPALVALLYNELAGELSSVEGTLQRQYRGRSVMFYLEAIGYTGSGARSLMAGEGLAGFENRLKARQFARKVPTTGKVDYLTLAVEADRNAHWFRSRTYEDVSGVPTLNRESRCARKSSPENIKAPLALVVTDLVKTAQAKQRMGEYAAASLLFNEVLASGALGEETAAYVERQTLLNVGRTLEVEEPVRCDPQQGKYVMNGRLRAALKKYQRAKSISVTGRVDYKTLRTMAETDMSGYLTEFRRSLRNVQRALK